MRLVNIAKLKLPILLLISFNVHDILQKLSSYISTDQSKLCPTPNGVEQSFSPSHQFISDSENAGLQNV